MYIATWKMAPSPSQGGVAYPTLSFGGVKSEYQSVLMAGPLHIIGQSRNAQWPDSLALPCSNDVLLLLLFVFFSQESTPVIKINPYIISPKIMSVTFGYWSKIHVNLHFVNISVRFWHDSYIFFMQCKALLHLKNNSTFTVPIICNCKSTM